MKRKRRGHRGAIAARWLGGFGCLTLLAALAVGGVFLYRRIMQGFTGGGSTEPPMATKDVVVTRGDVTDTSTLWGQVQPVRTQTLVFRTAGGRITTVDAMVGMPVTRGQPLVSLDLAALERTLAEARAALLQAQTDLAMLTKQDPVRQYELELERSEARKALNAARQALADFDAGRGTPQEKRATAVAALADARAALDELANGKAWTEQLAQLQYNRDIATIEHGRYTEIQNPSEQDRDREWLTRIPMLDAEQALEAGKLAHESAVRAARQKVVEAQRVVDGLDRAIALGSADVERAKLAVALQLAEARLLRAESEMNALTSPVDPVKLATAQAKVLKLQGSVDDAEAALGDAVLVAPFDGTVTEVQAIPQGMASTGAPMVKLADTSAYVVVATLSELDIARVKAGQEATLTFDAFGPESKVVGRVGEIPRYGSYENGVAQFKVSLTLDGLTLPVMEGMSASISIPLGVRTGVLTIPAAAVDYYPEGAYVNVVKGDAVERRSVQLGVGDGVVVEVTEGLEEGEVVRMRLVGNQVYGA